MPNIGKAASDAARAMHTPPDRMAEVAQQTDGWTWRDGLKSFQAKCADSAIPCTSPEEAKAARDSVCDATGRKDLIGKPFGKMDFADFQVLCFSTDTYVGAYVNATAQNTPPEVPRASGYADPEPAPATAVTYTATGFSVHVTRKVSHNYNSYEASVGIDGAPSSSNVEQCIIDAIAQCKRIVDAEIASDKGAE